MRRAVAASGLAVALSLAAVLVPSASRASLQAAPGSIEVADAGNGASTRAQQQPATVPAGTDEKGVFGDPPFSLRGRPQVAAPVVPQQPSLDLPKPTTPPAAPAYRPQARPKLTQEEACKRFPNLCI